MKHLLTSSAFNLIFALILFTLGHSLGNQGGERPTGAATLEFCDSSANQDKWFYNYSECDPQPTQISAMINISKEKVKGSQVALVSNFANKDLEKFQLSLVYNHVNNKMNGAQISLFVNYAKYVDGFQLGELNVAKIVKGWQLGDLNIADSIKGGQIGVLNLSHHIEGYSIGFLTLSRNGLFHVDVLTEETGMGKFTFATGKTFFTSYSLGYTFDSETNPYSIGMGVGYHKDLGRLFFEGSFNGNLILDKHTTLSNLDKEDDVIGSDDWRHNSLYQLKALIGAPIISNVGVFAGVNYNFLKTHDNETLIHSWTQDFTQSHDGVHYWPGFEVGLRFGR